MIKECLQCHGPLEELSSDRPRIRLYGCEKCDILWIETSDIKERDYHSLSEWKQEQKRKEGRKGKCPQCGASLKDYGHGLYGCFSCDILWKESAFGKVLIRSESLLSAREMEEKKKEKEKRKQEEFEEKMEEIIPGYKKFKRDKESGGDKTKLLEKIKEAKESNGSTTKLLGVIALIGTLSLGFDLGNKIKTKEFYLKEARPSFYEVCDNRSGPSRGASLDENLSEAEKLNNFYSKENVQEGFKSYKIDGLKE